jgi:hypothetical protein
MTVARARFVNASNRSLWNLDRLQFAQVPCRAFSTTRALVHLRADYDQTNKVMLDFSAASRKVTTPPTSTPSINSSFLIPMTSIDIEQATSRTP